MLAGLDEWPRVGDRFVIDSGLSEHVSIWFFSIASIELGCDLEGNAAPDP